MAKFVLIHGQLKVGAGAAGYHAQVLDRVELDPAAAKQLDPEGTKLISLEEWEIAKKEAKARAELEAKRKALGDDRPVPATLADALELEMRRLQGKEEPSEPPEYPLPTLEQYAKAGYTQGLDEKQARSKYEEALKNFRAEAKQQGRKVIEPSPS